MIALCDPEHFELAFIPAGNDVSPKRPSPIWSQ